MNLKRSVWKSCGRFLGCCLLKTTLHRYECQTMVSLNITPVGESNIFAEMLYLFSFYCLDSFTFGRIPCCSDTLPNWNKCKWHFFFLPVFKMLIWRDGNSAAVWGECCLGSSYLQVCRNCWWRDVLNSLQTFSWRKKLCVKQSIHDLSIITAYAWKAGGFVLLKDVIRCVLLNYIVENTGIVQDGVAVGLCSLRKYFISVFTFEMRIRPLKVCLGYSITVDINRQFLQRHSDLLQQLNCWEVKRGMGLSPWLKPALIAAFQHWDFTLSKSLSWDALSLSFLFCFWHFSKRIMSVSQESNTVEIEMLEFKNFISERESVCGIGSQWNAAQQSEMEAITFETVLFIFLFFKDVCASGRTSCVITQPRSPGRCCHRPEALREQRALRGRSPPFVSNHVSVSLSSAHLCWAVTFWTFY